MIMDRGKVHWLEMGIFVEEIKQIFISLVVKMMKLIN